MDTTVLAFLLILILSCMGAALSWRSVTSYLCIAIALIALAALVPGGPF